VLIYAAAESADVVGLNKLFHGPIDWVIVGRDENGERTTLASGNFPRAMDGTWGVLPAAP